MAELRYSDVDRCWTCVADTAFLKRVPVFVTTSRPDAPPSALQQQATSFVESSDAAFSARIDKLLQQWVSTEWEPDAAEDLEPEDFEWEAHAIVIPWVTQGDTFYFLMRLSCELEPEHGIGIACRNGVDFAVCHPESYDRLPQDDVVALNRPFVV